MQPGWDRHDYAQLAATLPGVRRLRRIGIVLIFASFASILVPLLVGITGAPRATLLVAPALVMLLVVGFILIGRAQTLQRRAIARWVGVEGRYYSGTQ